MAELLAGNFDMTADNKKIEHHLSMLDDVARQEFMSLAHSFPERPILVSIVQSNAFDVGPNYDAIFITTSRINHSCKPNIHYTWYQAEGVFKLHALRDISPNEELFVSYINTYQSRDKRQHILKEGFNFTCTCELCSAKMTKERRERSDKNLDFIDVGVNRNYADPKEELKLIHRLIKAIAEEGLLDDVFLMGHLHLKFLNYLLKFEPDNQIIEKIRALAISNLTMAFGADEARRIHNKWLQLDTMQ